MKPSLCLWALIPLLSGCDGPRVPVFQGYAEGEFLYLAAPQAGYLHQLETPRGSRVSEGQTVFVLAADPDRQGLAEAEARLAAARDKVDNLKAPRRAPEIAALEAQWAAARAAQQLSETQLRQQESLARSQFVSGARVDEARARRDADAAQVKALQAQITTARSTLGRQAEVKGAQAEQAAAAAQEALKRWQLQTKTVAAPVPGEVADTYFRPGEWVPAGAPVASLLPDQRRRIRFFVPETVVAQLKPGQPVSAHCDACPTPIPGEIDFIAPQAEYTPPVIYSRGSREKLVFRVEARPAAAEAGRLRPGLPLEVRLGAGQ